ncbi:hypothetical protein ACFL0H_02180 [Thermodesulfobacteriota bacterium]
MPLLGPSHTNDMNQKYTFFTLIAILALILMLSGLAYRYKEELHISQRLNTAKEKYLASQEISVKFNVIAGIGEQCLRLGFSLPCRNLVHKNKISKRLPAIKHELLMSMSRPEVAHLIEKRDFGAIKKLALQLINNHSTEKMKKLYVDFFFLN